MQQLSAELGFELGTDVSRTKVSIHGAPALATTSCDALICGSSKAV